MIMCIQYMVKFCPFIHSQDIEESPFIHSQDIEEKPNSDVNQGHSRAVTLKQFAKNDNLQSQCRSCQ